MVEGWALGATLSTAGLAVGWAGRIAWLVRRRARLLAVARRVTRRHARLLSVKQKQLVVHDGYGNYQLEPWINHVDYFIDRVILREARALGLPTAHLRRGDDTWSKLIRTLLATLHASHHPAAIEPSDVLSGEHYEVLCRDLLRARGWQVSTTPVTGDQGADLIADAGGRRVVIQCKFHAKPIGNKAVQEAQAAIRYHGGHRAAVVSNARFTRSAQDLAKANGVLLLHHDELPDLERRLGPANGAA